MLYKSLCVMLLMYLSASDQFLQLHAIYTDIFDGYYLLHFKEHSSNDVFIISSKQDSLEEHNRETFDSLAIGGTYRLSLDRIRNIPVCLKPKSGFNVQGKQPTVFFIGNEDELYAGKAIVFFDYIKGTFEVPLYSSPNIVGLMIRTHRCTQPDSTYK